MDIRRYQDRDVNEVKALHQLAMKQAGAYIPGPWDADMDIASKAGGSLKIMSNCY